MHLQRRLFRSALFVFQCLLYFQCLRICTHLHASAKACNCRAVLLMLGGVQVTKVKLEQKQKEGIAEARSGRRGPVSAAGPDAQLATPNTSLSLPQFSSCIFTSLACLNHVYPALLHISHPCTSLPSPAGHNLHACMHVLLASLSLC